MRHCPLFVGHMRPPLVAPFPHDDKLIQGQLERIDLIIESSEHLQAQRDNIFLSDLDILSANLSFYCRHLLQIIDTTVTTFYLTFCRPTKLAQNTPRLQIQTPVDRFYYVSTLSLKVMGSGSKASSTRPTL